MKGEKSGVVILYRFRPYLEKLTEAEQGQVLMAALVYDESGKTREFENPGCDMLFTIIRDELDKLRKNYEETCEKRREAGSKGGRPKQTKDNQTKPIGSLGKENTEKKDNKTKSNHGKAKKPDHDPDHDIDHEEKKNSSGAAAPDVPADPFPEPPSSKPEKELPEEAYSLASLLFQLHRDSIDAGFRRTSAQLKKWAFDIGQINRLDGRSWEDIEAVIRWAKADEFWCKNIIAGEKLRMQFDKLLANMRARPAGPRPRMAADQSTDGGIW